MLRRRYYKKKKTFREAERRKEKNEKHRLGRDSTGSLLIDIEGLTKQIALLTLAMTLLSNSGNSYIKISKSGFGFRLFIRLKRKKLV